MSSSYEGVLKRLLTPGVDALKLATVRGAELRGMLLRVSLGPWLLDGAARAAVARVYRLDLREIEALREIEGGPSEGD